MAGLDLLDGADVQIHEFGEFFLGDFAGHPHPADTAAEGAQLAGLFGIKWHALLRRRFDLTTTA